VVTGRLIAMQNLAQGAPAVELGEIERAFVAARQRLVESGPIGFQISFKSSAMIVIQRDRLALEVDELRRPHEAAAQQRRAEMQIRAAQNSLREPRPAATQPGEG